MEGCTFYRVRRRFYGERGGGKGVNFTGRGVDLPIGIYISHIDIVEQCLDIDNIALGNMYGITLIIIILSIIYCSVN